MSTGPENPPINAAHFSPGVKHYTLNLHVEGLFAHEGETLQAV